MSPSGPHNYICHDCAMQQGLREREGHVCSFHGGTCHHCGEEKRLCHVGDYLHDERKERSDEQPMGL